jgi:hypothetical protein
MRVLRILPITSQLPRKTQCRAPTSQSQDQVIVQYVNDLVDLTLSKIYHPLDQIPPSHPGSTRVESDFDLETNSPKINPIEIEAKHLEGEAQIPSDSSNLDDSNFDHSNYEGTPHTPMVDPNKNVNRPWLALDAVIVPSVSHRLPTKHPKTILPKFDRDAKDSVKDHIKKFMLTLQFMSVEHEDVVCHLFPYTFEGKSSTWYFSLSQGSITNCSDFKTTFLRKFGDNKSPLNLDIELSRINMDPK